MSHGFLPYGRQFIDEDDIASVVEALKSDFLTTGPLVEEYDRAFAAAVGTLYAASCINGTAALHLALLALGVGPGDEVVVPTTTFLATANAVRMTGADVVFADVDASTGLLTPETFVPAMARAKGRVRCAIPVHLNGQVCDMKALREAARGHCEFLVEDACHALGAEGAGFAEDADIACFSTHPVKAIATGEGGAVAVNSAEINDRVRLLRNHGMTRSPEAFTNHAYACTEGKVNPWYYEMPVVGWNYRLPDILCALGLSQLKKLKRFYSRRLELVAQYDRLLQPLAPRIVPAGRAGTPHGWHLYVVHIDFPSLGTNRAEVMRLLRQQGIGSQVHYVPVHVQPYYRDRYGELYLPGAQAYYSSCLSLPLFPSMGDGDVERVVGALQALK